MQKHQPSRRGRAQTYALGCAVSKAEHDRVFELARKHGLMVSDVVRAAVRARVRELEKIPARAEHEATRPEPFSPK